MIETETISPPVIEESCLHLHKVMDSIHMICTDCGEILETSPIYLVDDGKNDFTHKTKNAIINVNKAATVLRQYQSALHWLRYMNSWLEKRTYFFEIEYTRIVSQLELPAFPEHSDLFSLIYQYYYGQQIDFHILTAAVIWYCAQRQHLFIDLGALARCIDHRKHALNVICLRIMTDFPIKTDRFLKFKTYVFALLDRIKALQLYSKVINLYQQYRFQIGGRLNIVAGVLVMYCYFRYMPKIHIVLKIKDFKRLTGCSDFRPQMRRLFELEHIYVTDIYQFRKLWTVGGNID